MARTWVFRAGEAKIIDLSPGEPLPDGWHDTPQPKLAEAPAVAPAAEIAPETISADTPQPVAAARAVKGRK